MYLDHYGLNISPFALFPRLDFLFRSGAFEESMAHLVYGLKQNEAIVMITGPIGTGKTMAIQSFMSHLGGKYKTALITNTNVSPSELLDPLLLPMNTAVDGMHKVYVDDMSANFLRHGNPVQAFNAPTDGSVQVYIGEDENDANAEFIGVGFIDDDGLVAPKRIVVI